ncbi:hypothetical protein CC85DRAFT_32681 [Cutaneotrichosporon oleaginosum]|uniref:Uncharacterized protein n=1 Tax=Cutaneotrichosporon oleaginosum TaxID=879819 RepID=A0A0J1B8P6_9TREE|nr:uncharacterized protein CC85DRAFT_32681 [Cutaneotrichosporon oleaginosum]KLT44149.1 hypothetical protein CC85DRAFT_32681 [Cutaneotrichosporon oleaginosum]TXT09396.1 hypothetical protein COLE_03330 [Cutaneotrichosporon oleaginosum]
MYLALFILFAVACVRALPLSPLHSLHRRDPPPPPPPPGDEGARPPAWANTFDGVWDGEYPSWKSSAAGDWWDSEMGIRSQIEQLEFMIRVAEALLQRELADIWRGEVARLKAALAEEEETDAGFEESWVGKPLDPEVRYPEMPLTPGS